MMDLKGNGLAVCGICCLIVAELYLHYFVQSHNKLVGGQKWQTWLKLLVDF